MVTTYTPGWRDTLWGSVLHKNTAENTISHPRLIWSSACSLSDPLLSHCCHGHLKLQYPKDGLRVEDFTPKNPEIHVISSNRCC